MVYLGSLLRAVIALHSHVDNKTAFGMGRGGRDGKDEKDRKDSSKFNLEGL
jgi:hypothetical protein